MNKIEYETVQETAKRLNVTVRTVQKWAAANRIPGAQKLGKSWMIPQGAVVSDKPVPEVEEEKGIPGVYQITPFRLAMPLLNSRYTVGKCIEYINQIPDEDDRNIALSEYYYFSGRSEEATKMAEPYLDSQDPALRYSSNLICTFANLARGHSHLSRFAMHNLMEQVGKGLRSNAPVQFQAMGIFTATAASVLLHLPIPNVPPMEQYMEYLPDGMKLYACYILAHKAYLEKQYERSLTIADMGLLMVHNAPVIAVIYVHIVAAIALMNLRRIDEAKQHMETAWKLASPDGILEPFGEHHGLLQGMIEIYFKKDYPKEFKKIIDITYAFSAGWRQIHGHFTEHDVADNLSTTEFTIAMLQTRGWSYKEIAGHLSISERQVARKINDIYTKLGIGDSKELAGFMLA